MTGRTEWNKGGPTNRPRLVLFLKAPREGKVKTRLAEALGNARAVGIYRALVERQVRALPPGWPAEVCFDPPDAGPEMRDWLGDRFSFRAQVAGTLGDRMAHAVRAAFAEGEHSVICIGADCPELGMAELVEAERKLTAGHDLVFGPARDGGYYLLGMRSGCPEVFERIPWSSPDTLAVSLERARAAGRSLALLGEKGDIDFAEDWAEYLKRPRTPGDMKRL